MITLTDGALEVVRSYMDQSDGEFTALRIGISGGTPLSPDFELTLVGPDDIRESEQKVDVGDLTIVVEEEFVPRLEGATVDFVQRVNESGFEISLAETAQAAAPTLEGPLAERVKTVLETEINPAIASHGGTITLVGRRRHRDLPGDGRRVPRVRHVTHDAPPGCRAHGPPGGARGNRHPRHHRPRVG